MKWVIWRENIRAARRAVSTSLVSQQYTIVRISIRGAIAGLLDHNFTFYANCNLYMSRIQWIKLSVISTYLLYLLINGRICHEDQQ